ncbi:BTB/POZ/Kelch-associated protein [Klebsormidium nitens]|uniref:BTB/POZ/Kelch-associated protein n=1 Tax=Klebsormidium nitens TaxID=105231 RepID=A0A1Y1IJK9_KLENI|nr:BTB/POZ/Kelch-associated protein [Klebsormidium nitens]|eukprot:GAQ88318.1 BTB/POZ/Kelch-associated protein [Klebsormidium nitens]
MEKAQEAEVKTGVEKGEEEASEKEEAGSGSSEEQPGEEENYEEALGILENEAGDSEEGRAASEEEEAWVEEIPVNSIVLAAKSCVLRTMLSNGMKESDKSAPVVLKVTPEEKLAFKELLQFIYVGSLSPAFLQPDASIRALVDLLIVGDKFGVGSLMGAVLTAVTNRKRTVSDDVVLALEVPDALELYPEIKALVSKARAHVVDTFQDVETWSESLEFLTLGQNVVSSLLQSEELDAASEEEIFSAVLVWVRNNFDGMAQRQGAMNELSQHLRFGLMKGEFLLRSVLPLSEMALPETQERVRAGLYFQAFSDVEKLKSEDLSTQPRTGGQGRQVEILCNFTLDEAGARQSSPSAVCIGKRWHIDVQKDPRQDPPTVGMFLVSRGLPGDEGTMPPTRVDFALYVRVWPTGYWKNINSVPAYELKNEGEGYGRADALKMSWEDARKPSCYVGPTNEITVKVHIRQRKLNAGKVEEKK